MVDAVVHTDLQEGNGGKLEDAAEVSDLHKVLAFELRELLEMPCEVFGIPGGNFGRGLDAVRQSCGDGEFGVDRGFEEAYFGGGDMAGLVHGGVWAWGGDQQPAARRGRRRGGCFWGGFSFSPARPFVVRGSVWACPRTPA